MTQIDIQSWWISLLYRIRNHSHQTNQLSPWRKLCIQTLLNKQQPIESLNHLDQNMLQSAMVARSKVQEKWDLRTKEKRLSVYPTLSSHRWTLELSQRSRKDLESTCQMKRSLMSACSRIKMTQPMISSIKGSRSKLLEASTISRTQMMFLSTKRISQSTLTEP